jgi:hypothetical protein
MNEALIIVSTLAILFSLIALIMACIAISVCVGLKNSTHSIVWKPLDADTGGEAGKDHTDEFLKDDEIPDENPFKRKSAAKEKPPEDFDFMEDVADQNNF